MPLGCGCDGSCVGSCVNKKALQHLVINTDGEPSQEDIFQIRKMLLVLYQILVRLAVMLGNLSCSCIQKTPHIPFLGEVLTEIRNSSDICKDMFNCMVKDPERVTEILWALAHYLDVLETPSGEMGRSEMKDSLYLISQNDLQCECDAKLRGDATNVKSMADDVLKQLYALQVKYGGGHPVQCKRIGQLCSKYELTLKQILPLVNRAVELFNQLSTILAQTPDAHVVFRTSADKPLDALVRTLNELLSEPPSDDQPLNSYFNGELSPNTVQMVRAFWNLAVLMDKIMPLLQQEMQRYSIDRNISLLGKSSDQVISLLRDGYPRNHMCDIVNTIVYHRESSNEEEGEGLLQRHPAFQGRWA